MLVPAGLGPTLGPLWAAPGTFAGPPPGPPAGGPRLLCCWGGVVVGLGAQFPIAGGWWGVAGAGVHPPNPARLMFELQRATQVLSCTGPCNTVLCYIFFSFLHPTT